MRNQNLLWSRLNGRVGTHEKQPSTRVLSLVAKLGVRRVLQTERRTDDQDLALVSGE